MPKRLLLFIFFLCACCNVHAQEISFKDTIAAYNSQRLHINRTGMEVLGAWGIVNIAGGGIGYFTAKQDKWKYFQEMNFFWGVINTGIAASGFAGVRKEMQKKMTADQAYDRYQATKKLYLINIGLDVVYIGTGVILTSAGNNNKRNGDILNGFGKSVALQGVFLLLFDNVMFASHQRNNSNWFRIMNEIHVSGTGVGINHTFK
jgi:hypothetical protein